MVTNRIKTEVLKSFNIDNRYKINIEKILEGKYKNRYLVKSYAKIWRSYKITTLSASNIETDFEGRRIVKIEFKAHRMLKQAIAFAKHIKYEYYPIW